MDESARALAMAGVVSPNLLWVSWSALSRILERLTGESLLATDLLRYLNAVGVACFTNWSRPSLTVGASWRYLPGSQERYWQNHNDQRTRSLWKYTRAEQQYWAMIPPKTAASWRFTNEKENV